MANVKKINLKSKDFTEEFKQELKKKFPQVFNEDKVDCEKLKLVLGDEVDTGRERYGMNWPGKANAIRVAQEPSAATLKSDRDSSVDFDNTENLFLEGDNLEILKLLQRSYFGKIKMIYIDPPYNTGKEFIYPDKYAEGLETYLQYTGQVDVGGKKFTTNVETDGRFHSKWMNMMYSRLMLARNLLTDDGVIFISIDDHEVYNLKKIMDEIFGQDNFEYQLSVINNLNGNDNSSGMMETLEYCLIYSKDTEIFEMGVLNVDEEELKKWKIDDLGYWKEGGSLKATGINAPRSARPKLFFPIYINEKNLDFSLVKDANYKFELYPITNNEEMSWYWSRDKFIRDKNEVIVKKIDNGYSLYKKQRPLLGDLPSKQGKNCFYKPSYSNSHSNATIIDLFNKKVFDYSKSVELIKDFIRLGMSNKGIILDFFSGSGTTAHAVMELNAEDGGNRSFIMTQLQEPVDKDSLAGKLGYKNIAEIGKERIRRAGKKIMEENKNNDGFDINKFDKGFKVYKLDKSNFSTWDGKDNKDIQQKLLKHIDHISTGSTDEDVLYELLLKSGYELNAKVEEINLDKKKVYSMAGGELVICLDKDIDKGLIKKITELKPQKVITLNNSYKTDSDLTNAAQIFKTKEIEFRTV